MYLAIFGGFLVAFSLGATVLTRSHLGLPVSSTTAAVGAVTGVGPAQGKKNVNLAKLAKIMGVWVLTVPISGLASAGFFVLLKAIFL